MVVEEARSLQVRGVERFVREVRVLPEEVGRIRVLKEWLAGWETTLLVVVVAKTLASLFFSCDDYRC